MNPLSVLRDSFYFSQRNFVAIAKLCLPLVVLEALAQELVARAIGPDGSPVFDVLVGLLFYPLYTAALILFLDARSNGDAPRARDLLSVALRIWPMFALLTAISTALIMLGMSLFVLPGLWVMVKLVFSEYLLVLRGLSPLAAIKQSLELSRGHFWRILACILGVLIPLWLLDSASSALYPEGGNPVVQLLIDSANSFLQLFTSVVLFRLFMLITEPDLDHPAA
jgi:hypothetical protein